MTSSVVSCCILSQYSYCNLSCYSYYQTVLLLSLTFNPNVLVDSAVSCRE